MNDIHNHPIANFSFTCLFYQSSEANALLHRHLATVLYACVNAKLGK